MESAITKRIKEFISYKDMRISLFERNCGLANGYVNQIKRSIGDEKLKVISEKYPELNITWMLTGVGEMLNTKERESEIEDNIAENGDYNENMKNKKSNSCINDMSEEGTINQRIERVIEYSGVSLTAFAKKIGIAQTSLRECVKNGAEPKYSTLNKIVMSNPLISAEWLLRGEGDMYRTSNMDYEKSESYNEELLKNFVDQTSTLLSNRDERIRELEIENAALKSGISVKNVG